MYVKQKTMEQITTLLSRVQNPQSTDDIVNATKELLELFKEPSTIIFLFTLLNNQEFGLRQYAAVFLKKCIKNCWDDLDVNSKEDIKQHILNSLSTETNLLVAKNTIQSCKKVFKSDAKNWPGLFTFISNYNQIPLGLPITLYLIYFSAKYLGTDIIEANFNVFGEIANQGINSQDIEAFVLTCEMFGALISFISLSKISLYESQETFLIQAFINYLLNSDDNVLIERIGLALADTFLGEALPIPAVSILQQLLQLIQNPEFPKQKYVDVFNSITFLIKGHAVELIDEAATILKAAIFCGAAVFDPQAEDSIYDVNMISNTAGDLAGELKMPRFIKLVQSLTPDLSNDALYISYAHVLYHSIDECIEEVLNDFKSIVNIAIQFLNSSILQVKEVGALISDIIADYLEPSQLDVGVILLQNLIPFIVSGIPSITDSAFTAITSILAQGLIRNDLISPLLSNLLAVLENENMIEIHYMSIEAISSLIFAVEEDILPYSNQILPIIIKAATLPPDNPSADLIKQQAIIALGNIIRFGSQSIPDHIQQAVELILSSADPNDIDMNHSVLIALGNLIIAHCPILVNYREKIINIIGSIICYLINNELTRDESINDNKVEEDADFNHALQGFIDSLNIMEWIFKDYNELAPPIIETAANPDSQEPTESITKWMFTILQFMKAPFPQLQTNSITAGMYGTSMIMRIHPVDQSKYFTELINLFNSEEPEVVGACFKAFNYFVKDDIPIDPKYIDEAIKAAFCALEGSLQFQKKKRNFDFHSSKHVFRFFKSLFIKSMKLGNPEAFPLQKFISSGNKMLNGSRQLFEMAQYIKVLNFIYSNCHETIKSLSKKILIKVMIECFNRFVQTFSDEDIDYSSYSVPPSPIASIYLLLQFDPNAIKDLYPKTMQLIQSILTQDFNGERFYNATIATAIEFLCINYQLDPNSFDLSNWLPLILHRLPLKLMGNEKLSEHIYSVILSLLSNPDIVKQYGSEILRIFAQTLGVKDKYFDKFHFQPSTYEKIIEVTKQLISSSGATPESMKELFSNDEQSYMRMCTRINQ